MKSSVLFVALLCLAGIAQAQSGGTIAVLPFHYSIDQLAGSEEVSYEVQKDAVAIINKRSGGLRVQDPEMTNTLLLKAGITLENMRGYTYDEICRVLGVQYVVSGSVKQTKHEVVTNYSNTTAKQTQPTYNRRGRQTSSGGVRANTTSSDVVNEKYNSKVSMDIHNATGTSVFSKDHTSSWSGSESYKSAITFLWKKTTFFSKN